MAGFQLQRLLKAGAAAASGVRHGGHDVLDQRRLEDGWGEGELEVEDRGPHMHQLLFRELPEQQRALRTSPRWRLGRCRTIDDHGDG